MSWWNEHTCPRNPIVPLYICSNGTKGLTLWINNFSTKVRHSNWNGTLYIVEPFFVFHIGKIRLCPETLLHLEHVFLLVSFRINDTHLHLEQTLWHNIFILVSNDLVEESNWLWNCDILSLRINGTCDWIDWIDWIMQRLDPGTQSIKSTGSWDWID